MKILASACGWISLLCTMACCVSPHVAAVLTFPRPNVYGPYAEQLSAEETLQIAELPWGRKDIRKPVRDIYMARPDEANVTSGRATESREKMTAFKVRKANGRWQIVKGSIEEFEALFTS